MLSIILATWVLAQGQPPPDPTTQEWFQSLAVPEGADYAGKLCCDVSDGHAVEARQDGVHWEFKWGDEWFKVPDNIILRNTTAPDAKAYMFIYMGQYRCFVPPFNGY